MTRPISATDRCPPLACRRGSRRDGGLALTELLAALAIVSLCLLLAAPAFRPSSARLAADRAASAADVLRDARSTATALGRVVAVRIDGPAGRLTIDAPAVADSGGIYARLARSSPVDAAPAMVSFRAATSADAREGEGEVRFFPDGASSGGVIGFALDGARAAVRIDWATGRIGVERDARASWADGGAEAWSEGGGDASPAAFGATRSTRLGAAP